LIADIATARPANPVERLLYRAAASDPDVARRLHALASRRELPHRVLTPALLLRAARAAR
jgi:hypothetical protein